MVEDNSSEEVPQLRKKNGRTKLEVVVNFKDGIVDLDGFAICDECNNYQFEVRFRRTESLRPKECEDYYRRYFPNGSDGRSYMQLLMLAATRGTVLELDVEGVDEHAEKVARKLYGMLRTRGGEELQDFMQRNQ